MVDYKHIFYSKIPSVGNSSAIPLPFGASGGPGFGWHDVDVFKIGAEWRASPAWTLRAGYAHNTNPIKSTDVTLNIIAPGVVTDHITGGFATRSTRTTPLTSPAPMCRVIASPVPSLPDLVVAMSSWRCASISSRPDYLPVRHGARAQVAAYSQVSGSGRASFISLRAARGWTDRVSSYGGPI